MAPGLISDDIPTGDDCGTQKLSSKPDAPVLNGHSANGEKAGGDGESARCEAESKEADASKEVEEEPVDQTMKCEIKHLDRRYDDKDETYFVERKNDVEKPKQQDWWRLYAFCIVRHYDSEGDLDHTRFYVNPQPLRELLFDVIGNYPSDPIDVEDVQIEAPYHSLFHYRHELESEGHRRFENNEESLEQLNMLLGWIKSHFKLEIAAYDRCVKGDLKAISYDRLWTLLPPSKIVYAKLLDQHRAFRVLDTWYDESDIPGIGLKVHFIDFDGDRLGTRKMELFIPKYSGTRELRELNVMPLDMHDDVEGIRQELLERGRKFEAHIGQHYVQYDGTALKKVENRGYARFSVSGRVMIDCKTYHRLDPNDSFHVKEMKDDETVKSDRARRKAAGNTDFASEIKKFDKLSDEDACLTNATVRGYAFTVKRFLEFFVDDLSPIEWNTQCFDDLVLDAGTKKTVQALVSTHSKRGGATFDDIVKGKGQGLVCVLHGPPGVGKTLTAETVAEFVRRPLYMVSSGDLGVTSTDLDAQLTKVMDMTQSWRAVLLIDEADVFLERRSLHDLHRNAMVSVFLRVLEYYSGILFLTTNRVTTFDDAFKSRIHIPIRYTDLSVDSRVQIWRNFCARVPGGVDIDEAGLSTLAEHDLNGRQIKNVIKAAESLAAFDGAKLDLKQLQQVTKIQAVFEKDLNTLGDIDYTAPGSSKRDADKNNMFL